MATCTKENGADSEDSNPRPIAYKAIALTTELHRLTKKFIWGEKRESNPRITVPQTVALTTSPFPPSDKYIMKIRELLLCGAIDPTDPGQDMETPNSLSSSVGPTDVVQPMPQGTSPVSSKPANPLQQRQMQMAQQGQAGMPGGMMTPDDNQAMKMAKLYQQPPPPQMPQQQPSEQQQQPPDEDEQMGGPTIPGV